MIKKILVPLDGTKIAEAAMRVALAIGNRAGAEIRLASVLVDGDGSGPPDQRPEVHYLEEARRWASDHLRGDASISSVLLEGRVARALREEARAAADLVVMGSHGLGGFDRMWLGSVADAMIRDSPVPVVVVKPNEDDAGLLGPASIRRIVVPLDGTPLAECAIQPALMMGGLFDAAVTLFRAVAPPSSVASTLLDTEERTEELLRRAEAEAEAYLEAVRSTVDDGSCDVDCVVGVHRSAARAILEHVASSGADFVVLTTGKRYALSRGLLGSVADKVVRGSPAPVLVVRASDEESPSDD